MIHFAASALAIFALTAPALAVEFEPNHQGFTEFNMPSGNIGCFYVPAGGTDVTRRRTAARSFPATASSHPMCA